MKNIIKRILTGSMAVAVLVSLAGCGSTESAQGDGTQKHFSVFITGSTEEPSSDNKIMQKIKDELGYTFDFEYLVGNEAEKVGVMIAGGTYPDIVSCGDNKFVQAGALVALDDYISEEKTPNLYKHIKDCYNKLCYEEDGHLYVIPAYGIFDGPETDGVYQGPAFWIQKAVLADAGYPEIKTLDEYFELIENYKKKNPTINGVSTIGFDILATTGFEWVLTTAPNYLDGNPNDGDVKVDKETYEAKIYANMDFSKAYFKKLSEEYAKGVIDPEAFTQNKDQYISKISSGRVLGMFDQHWVFQPAEDSLGSQKLYERQYVPLPITLEEGIKPWYRTEPYEQVGQGYGISVSCKDPQAVVNMFETFLSEDWQKIFQWGFEGEDYMVSEEGRFYRTQEQRDAQSDSVWSAKNKMNAFFWNLPKIQGSYSDGNASNAGAQPEEFEASLVDYDKNFLAKYGKKNWMEFLNAPPENPIYFPAWNVDLIDGSNADYANQKLTDLSTKYLPKLIMSDGSAFDSVWKEYCDAINGVDIKSYEERMNDQIQWRVEHWAQN